MGDTTLEQELEHAAAHCGDIGDLVLEQRLRDRLAHLQTLRAIAWTLGEKADLVVMDGMSTKDIPPADAARPTQEAPAAAPKDSVITGHGAGQGPEQAARARAGSGTPSPVRREPGDLSAETLLGRWMYWASGVAFKSDDGEQLVADTDAFLALPAATQEAKPRETLDPLRTLTPEELAHFKPISDETINDALMQGLRARWAYEHPTMPSLPAAPPQESGTAGHKEPAASPQEGKREPTGPSGILPCLTCGSVMFCRCAGKREPGEEP